MHQALDSSAIPHSLAVSVQLESCGKAHCRAICPTLADLSKAGLDMVGCALSSLLAVRTLCSTHAVERTIAVLGRAPMPASIVPRQQQPAWRFQPGASPILKCLAAARLWISSPHATGQSNAECRSVGSSLGPVHACIPLSLTISQPR